MGRRGRPAGAAAFALAFAAAAAPARGQIPEVQPDGTLADPAAPPPQPSPPPAAPAPVQPAAGAEQEGQLFPEGGVIYFEDEGFEEDSLRSSSSAAAPLREHHVVRRGDTLWDIAALYFHSPWVWPRLWSYNPAITNPHWIYPGDLVRLGPMGPGPDGPAPEAPPVAPAPPPLLEERAAPGMERNVAVSLRQTAFVDREALEVAATIVGSAQEKMLLSEGDRVYLSYPAGPLEHGGSYAIYTEERTVFHPWYGTPVGSYVRILGELRVAALERKKRASAVIEDSLEAIERGARVGPVERTYASDQITPRRNEVDRRGVIVATLGADELIGDGQVLFVDLGRAQGVRRGNQLEVVRRGDAYDLAAGPDNDVGRDDPSYPVRRIASVLVVQVGTNLSAGLVTAARQEAGVGDRVRMRRHPRRR